MEQTGVVVTAVGIYSHNTSNNQVLEIQSRVTEIVMSHEYILQIHGFFCSLEEKTLRFDIVIDYSAPDPAGLFAHIRQEVQTEYPDFSLHIQPDRDVSD